MTYRLIIFDFDGTLADSAGWFRRKLNVMAERHRFRPVEEDEIDDLRGCNAREVMRRLRVPRWRLPFIAADMRRLMAQDAESIHCFDGARDLLGALTARGYAVAIVSSNSESNVRRILGEEATASVSLFACGSGLFGKPRKFRAVMRALGVTAAQTLCIGDELRDIDAARAVGAASGAVAWGYATPQSLADGRPDRMFKALPEIEAALS